MKSFLIISTLFGICFTSPVFATSTIYQCEVSSDGYIASDGVLNVAKDSPRIGQKFTVIKKTGEIIGDVMDALKNPRVVSQGNDKNAYKILWEQRAAGKSGAFVDYLSIEEANQGSKKPFGFFSGSMIMTGLCERNKY